MPMTLPNAKRIAGRVGARIVAKGTEYLVTIAGRPIRDPVTGHISQMTFHSATPFEAAHEALIQTAIHSRALMELAKRIYVEEDLLFGAEDK